MLASLNTRKRKASHDIANELAPFEVSQCTDGTIGWKSGPGGSTMQLFYSTDMKSVVSKGGPIDIKIDTAELSGFEREVEEEKNGNGIITLAYKNTTRSSIKLVFDRGEGSRIDLGKKQAITFTLWLRGCGVRYGVEDKTTN